MPRGAGAPLSPRLLRAQGKPASSHAAPAASRTAVIVVLTGWAMKLANLGPAARRQPHGGRDPADDAGLGLRRAAHRDRDPPALPRVPTAAESASVRGPRTRGGRRNLRPPGGSLGAVSVRGRRRPKLSAWRAKRARFRRQVTQKYRKSVQKTQVFCTPEIGLITVALALRRLALARGFSAHQK